MTYNLTLTLRDERGITKVKLIDVAEQRLRESGVLDALVNLHELAMAEEESSGSGSQPVELLPD